MAILADAVQSQRTSEVPVEIRKAYVDCLRSLEMHRKRFAAVETAMQMMEVVLLKRVIFPVED